MLCRILECCFCGGPDARARARASPALAESRGSGSGFILRSLVLSLRCLNEGCVFEIKCTGVYTGLHRGVSFRLYDIVIFIVTENSKKIEALLSLLTCLSQ